MSNISSEFEKGVYVVGTVHSRGSLQRALRMQPGSVDFLELRVDHFATEPALLRKAVPRLKLPIVLTVRHASEGGANRLSLARRRQLFMEYLPFASVVDVELRSVDGLSSIIAMARAHRVRLLISNHYFHSTPGAKQLEKTVALARSAGADLVKIAALTSKPSDVAALLSLFAKKPRIPLSVMGMGTFGKVSRLLLAQAGSRLNYGYIDTPNANGQWEATVLKARLTELLS